MWFLIGPGRRKSGASGQCVEVGVAGENEPREGISVTVDDGFVTVAGNHCEAELG